jgi:archaemetzincin
MPIQLIAVGEGLRIALLERLVPRLEAVFRQRCEVLTHRLDPEPAYDPVRRQYHSTCLLQAMINLPPRDRLLGVTEHDLFVPILTYVFGEAQLNGPCALVSVHRLQEEFYGLPKDSGRLMQRLFKESVHELGHTYGLRHCDDWRCAMSSSHAVERLDLKEAAFCSSCRQLLHPREN